ncbi:MAG TPA: N-acetyltransferase [Prolixibacteraceae bacterium]|jgi:predicted N-acetyltransferase YhbS
MNQILHIRKETTADYPWVNELTERAFKTMTFSNGNEGKLVDNLRKASTFIERLSLVAEINGQVVGHILLTPICIENGQEYIESLALAPVSVLPEFQNQGIGSQLILAAHQKAKDLGFESIIVLGHAKYYPRFGYQTASRWSIFAPFDLPSDDVFMALELTEGALRDVSGTVVYPPEFE